MNALESANTDRKLVLPLLIDDAEKHTGNLEKLKIVVCDPSDIIFKGEVDSSATKLDNENDLRKDEIVDKFYDWLFEKPWAVQYYIEGETIYLAIDEISKEDALLEIHSEEEFRQLKIEIIQPSFGHFTECADHDRDENQNTKKPPGGESEKIQLVSGTRIEAGSNSKAIFSSFVGLVGGMVVAIPHYGLTVGHIFDEFSKDCRALSPEGETRKIAECFLRPEIPRMTTDICFLKFLEGVNFNEAACLRIRLYTGRSSAHPMELGILSSELENRLDDAKFLKMSVKRHRFTDKSLNKHQVLILDFISNPDESTDKAFVCGAPVFDLSTSVEDELEMIGIVIGSYREGDADDMVVANYLPEVLRKIQKNPTYMDQLFPDTEGGESRIEVSSTSIIAKS